jgi:hypothetical protein
MLNSFVLVPLFLDDVNVGLEFEKS